MKYAAFLILLFLSACQHKPSQQQVFFDHLLTLCGQTFVGASTFPADPNHDFAGKQLVARFASCQYDNIRIAFAVGEDHSRTWILTMNERGLLLKHDHRHEDGTPDQVTNYGGWANENGNSWQQYFLADEFTAELIPEAATNVWMLHYDEKKHVLTYDLRRHGKPRYQAQLKRQ